MTLRPLDYLTLMKPRINLLVLVTTFVGVWWAIGSGPWPLGLTIWTLIGTGLSVGSANALNHYGERDTDALMERTRERPLPAGRLEPISALIFSLVTGVAGLLILAWAVNWLSMWLALLAILSYFPLYTMLKPATSVSTLIGAIPGAIPPVIGWVAVRGTIDFPAVILFFVLFLWQPPHFIALALYLKDDYERAGLAMLPVETNERASCRQLVIYTGVLTAVTVIPHAVGLAGWTYLGVALTCGLGFVGLSLFLWHVHCGESLYWARILFLYSIVYLPVVLTVLILDRAETI